MIIELVGRRYCKGTSRDTGERYEYTKIYYLDSERGVDGRIGKEKNIYPEQLAPDKLVVGQCYDIEFNDKGYVRSIKIAKP